MKELIPIPEPTDVTGAYETLEPQRRMFVSHFLSSFSVKQAATKAKVPYRTAAYWMTRQDVKNAILEKQNEVAQQCDISYEECLNHLARIARFDHKDYASNFKVSPETGEIGLTLEEFDQMDTSCIQEMSAKVNAQGVPYLVIKPYNKIEALKELLNRLEGTNGDKHLHFHLDKEEAKNKTAAELSSTYQEMVQNAMTR